MVKKILTGKRTEYKHEYTFFGDNREETIEKLKIAHEIRQTHMKEGAINQTIMGNFYGWKYLGKGHKTGLDIARIDKTIFCEIKNKHNTCNSTALKGTFDKLAKCRCILSIVNPKPNDTLLIKEITHHNQKIEIIQGKELLKLIFTYNDIDYSKTIQIFIQGLRTKYT